jgi:hypothetical protein
MLRTIRTFFRGAYYGATLTAALWLFIMWKTR